MPAKATGSVGTTPPTAAPARAVHTGLYATLSPLLQGTLLALLLSLAHHTSLHVVAPVVNFSLAQRYHGVVAAACVLIGYARQALTPPATRREALLQQAWSLAGAATGFGCLRLFIYVAYPRLATTWNPALLARVLLLPAYVAAGCLGAYLRAIPWPPAMAVALAAATTMAQGGESYYRTLLAAGMPSAVILAYVTGCFAAWSFLIGAKASALTPATASAPAATAKGVAAINNKTKKGKAAAAAAAAAVVEVESKKWAKQNILLLFAVTVAMRHAFQQLNYLPAPVMQPVAKNATTDAAGTSTPPQPLFTTLSARESNSGFISVVHDHVTGGGLLALRADHSILGGIYLQNQNDSIYGCFYYPDFVLPQSYDATTSLLPRRVLVLGVGIGTAPSLFAKHGDAVTAVEFDPAVMEAAHTHFNLPPLHREVIGDAREFVESSPATPTYDLIVHDVFTAGILEPTLFSIELMRQLKTRMAGPGAVLTVNVVASMDAASLRAITATLRHVFAHVEAFCDIGPDTHDAAGKPVWKTESVYNLVFFASDQPLVYRSAARSAREPWMGPVYTMMLNTFAAWQVPLPEETAANATAWLITDANNPFQTTAQQWSTLIQHWFVMENVFPRSFWSMF